MANQTRSGRNLDVLLVNPMFSRVFGGSGENVPFGLRYMKSALKQAGFSAEICNLDYSDKKSAKANAAEFGIRDYFLDGSTFDALKKKVETRDYGWWNDFAALLESLSPKLIGITMMTPHYNAANMAARVARKICPEAGIVAGGVHCTVLPEEVMDTGLYDAVAIGEGESTIVELAKHYSAGDVSLADIKGICFRGENGLVKTAPGELCENLDKLAFPSRESIAPPAGRKIRIKYTADIITGRGCPFNCTHCAAKTLWPRSSVRFRSMANIRDEIKKLQRDLEVYYFYLFTDTFNIRRDHVIDFCEMLLSNRIRANWHCYLRPGATDREMASLMRKAGCDSVYFGVESGSPEILEKMKKGATVEQAEESVKLFRRKGFRVACSFILGHPDETRETLSKTEVLARELKVDKSVVFIMTPFPGTEIFDRLASEDRLATRDWFRYNMMNAHLIKRDGLSNESILESALELYEFQEPVRRNERLRKRRPANVLRKLRDVRSLSRLKYLARRFFQSIADG